MVVRVRLLEIRLVFFSGHDTGCVKHHGRSCQAAVTPLLEVCFMGLTRTMSADTGYGVKWLVGLQKKFFSLLFKFGISSRYNFRIYVSASALLCKALCIPKQPKTPNKNKENNYK